MSNGKIDGKDFMIGAFVGGLLGAAAALLLAPKSGRELRKDISEQYAVVSDKTQQIASVVGEKSLDIAKTVSLTANEWAQKAKEKADTVINEVKQWRDNNKQTASAQSEESGDKEE